MANVYIPIHGAYIHTPLQAGAVFAISNPIFRIGLNIHCDLLIFLFGADDVFVVVSLPNRKSRGLVDPVDG